MQHILKVISPNSTWGLRLQELISDFPEVPEKTITVADFGYKEFSDWQLWQ